MPKTVIIGPTGAHIRTVNVLLSGPGFEQCIQTSVGPTGLFETVQVNVGSDPNHLFETVVISDYVAGSPASYVGPGDVVAGALAWWGLRAYSAATIGTNAVRIVRASDSAQQDFVTLANGSLDVASIATFLAATSGKIVTLYDQTGHGNDFVQASNARRPDYAATGIGSLPAMVFNPAPITEMQIATFSTTQTIPWTVSAVANRTGTAAQVALCIVNGVVELGYENSGANTAFMYDGNVVSGTVSDGAWHALQATFNAASSDLYVDGSVVASGNPSIAPHTLTSAIYLGSAGGSTQYLTGSVAEIGFWSGFSSGDKSAMNANQHAYWGF